MFLSLAYFAAAKSGSKTTVQIPENGAIALNFPLNSSRRGACSTRTVHPYFLHTLESALRKVGLDHRIENPLGELTKGEVNASCANPKVFEEGYKITNSCAKSGHRRHWKNRRAHACGTCVPCIFRRASLHKIGLDSELFGNDALVKYPSREDVPADVRALAGFVQSNPDRHTILRILASNGSLPAGKLTKYAETVERMRLEVRKWMADRGSRTIKNLAGIRSTK